MIAYRDDRVTLLAGDCRELLGDALRGLTAVVIVDPPYGRGYRSGHLDPRKQEDTILGDADSSIRDHVLDWASARSAPHAELPTLPVACFGPWRGDPLPGARARLVWDKGPCSGMGDLSLPWRADAEDVWILGPGWRGERRSSVLRHHVDHAGSKPWPHPHAKPLGLLAELIECAPPGLVLDPCCGSGSTLLAARSLGRQALGIELDPEHVQVAVERLRQGELFTPSVAS